MKENTHDVYVYSPLKKGQNIKVIQLLPAKHGDVPFSCLLQTIDLGASDWSKYDALSYTWGDHGDEI